MEVRRTLYLKFLELVPTHEWQSVQPGQPIPAGMHVRFDFVTGRTEAKIMDDNDSENYGNFDIL